jgi:hypothetical protein
MSKRNYLEEVDAALSQAGKPKITNYIGFYKWHRAFNINQKKNTA